MRGTQPEKRLFDAAAGALLGISVMNQPGRSGSMRGYECQNCGGTFYLPAGSPEPTVCPHGCRSVSDEKSESESESEKKAESPDER